MKDYINWWKRKDVSLKFKILNMLSGDKLRKYLAFSSLNLKEALGFSASLPAKFEDFTERFYYVASNEILYHINMAIDDYEDIWRI